LALHPLICISWEAWALPFLAPISNVLQTQERGHRQPSRVSERCRPLTQRGVPSFAPGSISGVINYHHTAADTFDKVNQRNWRRSLVMAVLAYWVGESGAANAQ
jgi:hypothetical protein